MHLNRDFKRAVSTLTIWALVGLWSTPANAGSNPAAEALFQEGKKAMDQGDYATACRQFAESDRLEPAAGTKMNQANCEETRGRVATAWALYKSVLGGMDEDDKRYSFVKGKVQKLEPKVPKLTLIPTGGTPPSDLVVEVAGQKFTSTSFRVPLPIDPGSHTVTVAARGFQPQEAKLELAEGEERDFRFAVAAAAPAAAAPAAGTPAQESAPAAAVTPPEGDVGTDTGSKSSWNGMLTLGVVTTALGVGGLGTGAVLGVMVLQRKQRANDNCWEPTEDFPEGGCYPRGAEANRQGKELAQYTTIALAGGGLLTLGGVTLIIVGALSDADSAQHGEPQGMSVATLEPTPGGAKLTWTSTF